MQLLRATNLLQTALLAAVLLAIFCCFFEFVQARSICYFCVGRRAVLFSQEAENLGSKIKLENQRVKISATRKHDLAEADFSDHAHLPAEISEISSST